ncbi:MAG: PcfJ domain-containing protein [Brevibacillus sp.]|nr:PcfJ domain-containing protein [Brevibacillus sp.]
MPKTNDYQEFFAHFPQTVSQAMVDFATDTLFLSSRYLFVRRVGSMQFGYCTHCKQEYLTSSLNGKLGLKHNQDWQCLKCKSLVIVKASGISRKRLIDDAYFVWYEKSAINPKAIVALGIYAVRDYTGNYYETETKFKTAAMYLFEPGENGKPGRSKMLRCCHYWSGFWGRGSGPVWNERWEEAKSIISEFDHSMKHKRCHLALESVVQAVHGTPFQYSTWGKYTEQSPDLVKFFDLAAKYPCVEYLTKLGLRSFIEAKLCGYNTYGAINWRGKTMEKVLRLSKAEIKEMRSSGLTVKPITLHSYRFFKHKGLQLTFQQARKMEDLTQKYYTDMLKPLLQHAPFKRVARYFLKQLERHKSHYGTAGQVLTAWRDYLKECQELGMDLSQEHVLFPNDLHAAHLKTTAKIKIKRDEALNALIAKRLPKLEKYTFEKDGLFIRPAKDSSELFLEGKALQHCVGQYAKRYAEGQSDLFFIRRSAEPDKPFYTVEVVGNKITQAYGYRNCLPTPEVQAFIDAFIEKKLLTKKRTRIDVTGIQPAERQGVAV